MIRLISLLSILDYFDEEITKYQWPDPFENLEDARNVLQGFLDEMGKEKGYEKYERL